MDASVSVLLFLAFFLIQIVVMAISPFLAMRVFSLIFSGAGVSMPSPTALVGSAIKGMATGGMGIASLLAQRLAKGQAATPSIKPPPPTQMKPALPAPKKTPTQELTYEQKPLLEYNENKPNIPALPPPTSVPVVSSQLEPQPLVRKKSQEEAVPLLNVGPTVAMGPENTQQWAVYQRQQEPSVNNNQSHLYPPAVINKNNESKSDEIVIVPEEEPQDIAKIETSYPPPMLLPQKLSPINYNTKQDTTRDEPIKLDQFDTFSSDSNRESTYGDGNGGGREIKVTVQQFYNDNRQYFATRYTTEQYHSSVVHPSAGDALKSVAPDNKGSDIEPDETKEKRESLLKRIMELTKDKGFVGGSKAIGEFIWNGIKNLDYKKLALDTAREVAFWSFYLPSSALSAGLDFANNPGRLFADASKSLDSASKTLREVILEKRGKSKPKKKNKKK